jgi:hypothetical protein
VKETGLPISFALSINKTVSKIGTGGKPKGHLDIPENQVRAFLNPLSIQKILWWSDFPNVVAHWNSNDTNAVRNAC